MNMHHQAAPQEENIDCFQDGFWHDFTVALSRLQNKFASCEPTDIVHKRGFSCLRAMFCMSENCTAGDN